MTVIRQPLNYPVQSNGSVEADRVGYYTEQVKPPLVIYHSPCLDGFTAAWACWLKFPEAEFVPGVYGQEPPNCIGRDVYLLDFSYKRKDMDKIIALSKSITVLDHHKTAQAEMEGLAEYWRREINSIQVNVVFDMNKSGARLSWEWFHPGTTVPMLVQYVEDRDLWRFALPNSKAVNAALFSYDYDFVQWNELSVACSDEICLLALQTEGEAIERKQAKDIRELVGKLKHARSFTKQSPVYIMPCANLPYTLASDAAGLMARGEAFAATYYQDADGWFVFSLRSRGDTGVDVSEVAKQYGGGGHRNAAGFRVQRLEDL